MNITAYSDYLFFMDVVKYLFCAIGIISFIYYSSKKEIPPMSSGMALFLLVFSVVLMGACPLTDTGGDRDRYFEEAMDVARFGTSERINDYGYFFVNLILTRLPMSLYFYLHAFLYVIGIYIFCRSTSYNKYGLLFLGCMLNFQFYSYGVNGMRAGLAQSMLMIAMANRDKWRWEWLFIFFSVTIHKSFALPALCYLITKRWDKTNWYFYVWLLSIPLSAVAGNYFQELFAGLLGGEDERVSYLAVTEQDTSYKVGFRIDFILFSCAPVLVGYYLIYKKNFQDVLYKNLFNMYLLANTFWILVIRADYSDRFAYLSWFIFTIILLYPFVKDEYVVAKPNQWVACIIIGLTLFRTFIG